MLIISFLFIFNIFQILNDFIWLTWLINAIIIFVNFLIIFIFILCTNWIEFQNKNIIWIFRQRKYILTSISIILKCLLLIITTLSSLRVDFYNFLIYLLNFIFLELFGVQGNRLKILLFRFIIQSNFS